MFNFLDLVYPHKIPDNSPDYTALIVTGIVVVLSAVIGVLVINKKNSKGSRKKK